jgi:regulator of RNase E activity RraA
LHNDEDGGIVIPSAHVAEVLDQAEQLNQKDVLIRRELENGVTLQQALDKYGHV